MKVFFSQFDLAFKKQYVKGQFLAVGDFNNFSQV